MLATLSAAAAALVAVLLLVIGDPKDESGKLSHAGKALLLAIISSGLLSAYGAYLDSRASSDRERDIKRALFEVSRVRLQVVSEPPLDDPALWSYRTLLDGIVEDALVDVKLGRDLWRRPDIYASEIRYGEPAVLTLGSTSRGYPTEDEDKLAHALLNRQSIHLTIFRDTAPLTRGGRFHDDHDVALEFSVRDVPGDARNADPMQRGWSRLSYDLEGKRWLLETPWIVVPTERWRFGVPFSLVDLAGAQMIIDPFSVNLGTGWDEFDRLRGNGRLVTFRFSFFRNRLLYLEREDLVEHRTRDGGHVYEYRFPDTVSEVLELFSIE